jgi:hypothetical protein
VKNLARTIALKSTCRNHERAMPGLKKNAVEKASADPFGTAELLKLVAQKLASQSLLFGLAVVVVLAASWKIVGKDWPLAILVVVIFAVALAGYLFVEQKTKVAKREPATMSRLNRRKMKDISNPVSDFTVEVWTAPAPVEGARDIAVAGRKKKAGYRIGQKIVVGFRASRDCYLTLLNIGTSGKLTVLFPNALHKDNFIKAGRDYRIPEPSDDFEYELQGPSGTEKIKAVATLKKMDLLESNFAPDGSLFRTVDAAAGARDIGIVQKKVASAPQTEWSDSSCEFTVS